jgi:hypothetical protein
MDNKALRSSKEENALVGAYAALKTVRLRVEFDLDLFKRVLIAWELLASLTMNRRVHPRGS